MSIELLQRLVGAGASSTPIIWEARVKLSPHKVFMTYEHDCWTYQQSFDECLRFCGWLQSREQDTGRVVSYLSNSPGAVWAWFGTHFAGSIYFPLNREQKGELLKEMLNRSKASVLVTEASALSNLPNLETTNIKTVLLVDHVDSMHKLKGVDVFTWEDVQTCGFGAFQKPAPWDIATIMFTSGTTGRSKAVQQPHNVFCRSAARVAHAWQWNENDVFHAWLPLYHIAGQLHQTMSMIVTGGSIALFPKFSLSRFWQQVSSSQATVVCGLSNVLNLLMQKPRGPNDHQTSLRSIISSAIPVDIHQEFEKRFGVKLMEQYGMTEAELLTLPSSPEQPIPLGSCGKAGPDFELQIVDEHDQPVPAGVTGEVVVRPREPDLMMSGYEHDAAATVAAWRNLWFHTGDFAYLDGNGFMFYQDRIKHVIRRRSENISSLELENILQKHPAIRECAAVGVASALGEQDVKVVISLVPKSKTTPRAIYDYCVDNMARFMIPRYIELVEELPHNHVGKVEKEKLKDIGPDVWDEEIVLGKRSK